MSPERARKIPPPQRPEAVRKWIKVCRRLLDGASNVDAFESAGMDNPSFYKQVARVLATYPDDPA